ncbi:MAG: adenylyl-sulfate kinase [Cyclobacteriaceae bacterium]|nr:adenylyl-sulfate kinase [Cyclobacteriaceae bacterium]
MAENIHPIFDSILNRSDKEKLLEQRAIVVWLTGLSGSGKSTIAKGVEHKLYKQGVITKLLDGDNLRTGLNGNLGFSEEDREENIRRVAEVAKLFVNAGIVTLCSFVSPTLKIREQAAQIIGDDFHEVYVKASFETCAERDVKGLYKKALAGEIKNFTGLDAPFEEPEKPYLTIDTNNQSAEESVDALYESIIKLIKPNAHI